MRCWNTCRSGSHRLLWCVRAMKWSPLFCACTTPETTIEYAQMPRFIDLNLPGGSWRLVSCGSNHILHRTRLKVSSSLQPVRAGLKPYTNRPITTLYLQHDTHARTDGPFPQDACCAARDGPSVFSAAEAPVNSSGYYEVGYRIDESVTGCSDAESDVANVVYRRGGCAYDSRARLSTLIYCDDSGVLQSFAWNGTSCGGTAVAHGHIAGNRCSAQAVQSTVYLHVHHTLTIVWIAVWCVNDPTLTAHVCKYLHAH